MEEDSTVYTVNLAAGQVGGPVSVGPVTRYLADTGVALTSNSQILYVLGMYAS